MKGERPRWVVGVDIGGTNLRIGRIPAGGRGAPAGMRRRRTRARSASDVLDRILTMIHETVAHAGRDGVAGIGLGAPGPVDRKSGVVLEAPNLGWRDYPLRDLVAEATGLPVAVENDANCFAYGEWWMGAGRDCRRLVGITLGTGVGGGFVIDGEIYRGASGAAGEVGHMSVDFAGRPCACGSRGCVEAYASGPGIAARAVEAINRGADSILAAPPGGHLGKVTAEAVCSAAAAGDDLAERIVRDTADVLATAVANVIHLFNPDVVVVGGGVANARDLLIEPLREEVGRRTFSSARRACRIRSSQLGDAAGIAGAAGVFRRTYHAGL